jgi:anti-anti-sigma factor
MGQLENGGPHATVDHVVDASGLSVITIAGEVDTSNVASVEAELERVTGSAPELLVFDLSALEFIDSSGIALLLRSAGKVGRLELRNPSGVVQRVIEATGLSDVLRVQP